jgi:2-dehydro-3-deoxyphosphogluconate aldolase/(4S)-4-hydroxy-2-oxoglutarate aldolase
MPDLHLGIGTIKKEEDAAIYSALGAEFIVSPIIDTETAEYCRSAKLLWIPGCMTPTEISVAEKQGAKLIKLFPGNVLGPGYVKAIKPLFPGVKFMPTGGVEPTKESIASWMDAGVVCVGMGSNLISKTLIENKDWDTLKEKVLQSFAIIKGMK